MSSGPLGRPNGRFPFCREHELAPIFLRKFEEKVINSPAPVHQWHGLAICERRARVVLPSCTTHAAAESVEPEQAAMLQVRGGMSEVITSHIATDR